MDDFDHCSFTIQLGRILNPNSNCDFFDTCRPLDELVNNSRVVGILDDKVLIRLFFFMAHCANNGRTLSDLNSLQVSSIPSWESRVALIQALIIERISELFEDEVVKLGVKFYIAVHKGDIVLGAIDPVAPTFR